MQKEDYSSWKTSWTGIKAIFKRECIFFRRGQVMEMTLEIIFDSCSNNPFNPDLVYKIERIHNKTLSTDGTFKVFKLSGVYVHWWKFNTIYHDINALSLKLSKIFFSYDNSKIYYQGKLSWPYTILHSACISFIALLVRSANCTSLKKWPVCKIKPLELSQTLNIRTNLTNLLEIKDTFMHKDT